MIPSVSVSDINAAIADAYVDLVLSDDWLRSIVTVESMLLLTEDN